MAFSVASDRWIDFCIWVLEVDGLQVPPFDRHGPGDGSLRALGLDAAGWTAWFSTVVAQQARRESIENAPMERWATELDVGRQPEAAGFTETEREEVQALSQLTPALMWPGARAMVEALSELWWRYGRLDSRSMDVQRPVGGPELLDRIRSGALPLSRLRVLLVDYPGVFAYAVPPDTVILAVRGPRLPAGTYDEAILSVLPALTAQHAEGVQPQLSGMTAPAMPPAPSTGATETGPNPDPEAQPPMSEPDDSAGSAFERLALRMLALSYEQSMRGMGIHGDRPAPRLLPEQLPDDLPFDLPLPDEPDLLGSFTMGTHAMILLETTLSPFQARDFYRAHLLDAGWTEAPSAGARRTGFEVRDGFTVPDVYCRSDRGPSLFLMVQPGHRLRTEVRLLVDTERDSPRSPCSAGRREHAKRVEAERRELIPELLPPDDAVQVHEGTGSRGNRHMSQARLQTNRPLTQVVQHYDEQLQRAGWRRHGSDQAEGLAWSAWSYRSESHGEGYGLFWVVQDPMMLDHYTLTVEAIEQRAG